jgi:hypothetical protein
VKASRMLPILATIVGLLLVTSSHLASAQEYKKLSRLGTSESVCPGGVETAADLQSFFASNPNAIRDILADSGWAGDAETLLAAVAQGEMTERAYPVGTQMAWMGAKKNGAYKANSYRQWAGAKSFEAFQVNVSSGCQVYHIAIPKDCCNVSLINVQPDNSNECSAGDTTARDAEAAAARDAAAKQAADAAAAKKALALIPFFGVFAGSEVRPRYEPSWDMDMVDSSGVIGVRAGLMKAISAKTSMFGQVSYYDRQGINDGNIYPEDNFSLDIGLERKLSGTAFIGGGIGAWNVDDSDYRDTSIFGHVGGSIGKSKFQWFLEGRLFDSDSANHDSLSDNKMFSAGVRYLVK